MSYYTGSASNHADCFDKLRVHAALDGWGSSLNAGVYTFQNDGFKIDIPTDVSGTGEFKSFPSIETTASGTHNLGVLAATTHQALLLIKDEPIISYHAFVNVGTTPFIVLSMQVRANSWRHMIFGIIEKSGSWQGGAFMSTTYASNLASAGTWNSAGNTGLGIFGSNLTDQSCIMSYTNDSAVLVWDNTLKTTGFDLEFNATPSTAMLLFSRQPNQSTGETLIVPVDIFTTADGGGVRRAGKLPELGLMNVLFTQQEQTVVIGADTWMFLPMFSVGLKADTGNLEESYFLGYSFKK